MDRKQVGYLPSILSSKDAYGTKQEKALCPESLRQSMAELYARVDEELSQRKYYSERCRELSKEMKQYSGKTEGSQFMVSTIVIADLLIQLDELQSKNEQSKHIQTPITNDQSLLDSSKTHNETIQDMSLLDSQLSKNKSSKKALAQSLSQAASKIVALRSENETLRAELELHKQTPPVIQKEDPKLRSELQLYKKNLAMREIQIDALLCLNEVNEEMGLRARSNRRSNATRGAPSGKRGDHQTKDGTILKTLKDKVAQLEERSYKTENMHPNVSTAEALSESVPISTPSKTERETDSDISLENYYTPTSTRTGSGSDIRYSPLKISMVSGMDSIASKENNGAMTGCKPVTTNGVLGPSINNPGPSIVN